MTVFVAPETPPAAPQGLTRRSLLRTAAWSAPVIAVVVAAPLASASPTTPRGAVAINDTNSLSVDGDNVPGTEVTGSFGGSTTVTNRGTTWAIDTIDALYQLTGPVAGTFLLFNGAPIESTTLSSEGFVWSVLANTPGSVRLSLVEPLPVVVPVEGSVTVPLPTITFVDTLTATAFEQPASSQLRASAQVTVMSKAGSLEAEGAQSYPARLPVR